MNNSQAIQQLSALFLRDEESEYIQRYQESLKKIQEECQNQVLEIETVRNEQQEELDRLENEATRTYPKENFNAKISELQKAIESERKKHDDSIRFREILERKLEYLKEELDRVEQREELEIHKQKETIPSALKKRRVYANILPIVWQNSFDQIKGFFHYGDYVEPFEFNQNQDPIYITNQLWKMHAQNISA